MNGTGTRTGEADAAGHAALTPPGTRRGRRRARGADADPVFQELLKD
ncbi:hypothetical protein [Streptomyces avermitilis]